MKKFAVILLVLSIAASFTGCGKNTDENTNQNVVENEPVKVEQPVVDVEQAADVEQVADVETENKPEKKKNFKDISKKMWASADCNVREKANKNADKIGRLEMADQVKVTGEGVNACKGYYRIEFKGKTGYVSKKYLMDTKVKKPSPQSDKAISTVVQSDNNSSSSSSSSSSGNKKPSSSSSSSSSKPSGGSSSSKPSSGGRVPHGDASQFGSEAGKGGTITDDGYLDTDPADVDTSGWH